VKWAVAAAIVVAAVQLYARLDRHNQLVEAIINDIKQAQIVRQQMMERQRPPDPEPEER